jgi:hypothetical protein
MGWVIAAVVIVALMMVVWRVDHRNKRTGRAPDVNTEVERGYGDLMHPF